MKSSPMRTTLSVVIFFYTFTTNAANYYFSSNSGSDTYTIAQAQNPATPWQTITKFNAVFASLQPGDSVLFKRGESFYGSMIISRSGTHTLRIFIGAYGSGKRPRITGFQSITSWIPIGQGIYENTCASCPGNLNLILFDDSLQPMGRYPKLGSANGGYLILDSHVGTTSITSSQISGAANFVGGEIVIRKYQWILDRGRITGQSQQNITYTPFPSPGHLDFTYEPIDGHGFFFQNHENTLSQLGDWCFESNTKKFKMYFGAENPNAYSVKVTISETLVDITSRSYIVFDNLSFEGSNSKTFNVATSSDIQITNCDIDFSGVDAIYVSNSVSNGITVSSCSISHSNNNGISSNNARGWIIQNNKIENTGMIRGAGLSGDGQYNAMAYIGENSLVEYNRVKRTGYLGINFQGNSIRIKNNFIDSFCMIKTDGGGIYTYGEKTKTGRTIVGNIVINGVGDRFGLSVDARTNPYSGDVTGIYLDGGATNVEITGNTVAFCDYSGLHLGSTQNAVLLNNTLYNNKTTQLNAIDVNQSLANITLKHNILFSKYADQLVAQFELKTNNISTMGTLDSNFYCRPILEPQNLEATGYRGVPFNDGGIVWTTITGSGQRFRSLDKWKIFSGQDLHTKKTPVRIDTNNIRFEYNANAASKRIPLDGIYIDVENNIYYPEITLLPYSSAILMKVSSTILSIDNFYFNGQRKDENNILRWQNAEEANDEYFSIERSEDGNSFVNIAKVNAEGNATGYTYIDLNSPNQVAYYRLKQVYKNGFIRVSNIVQLKGNEKFNLDCYPNPVVDQLNIKFSSPEKGMMHLRIFDTHGKVVSNHEIQKSDSELLFNIDMTRLAPGPYILYVILNNKTREIRKLVRN